MELGGRVCTPETPDCPQCPVLFHMSCVALANGWQQEIPLRAARVAPTPVTEVAVAVQRGGRYLMLKRPPGERWAGLWDFVRFGWNDGERQSASRIAGAVHEHAGVEVEIAKRIAEIRHSVTRFRITLCCYAADWRAGELDGGERQFRWIAPQKFATLPLSVTGRKLARLVQGHSSGASSLTRGAGF